MVAAECLAHGSDENHHFVLTLPLRAGALASSSHLPHRRRTVPTAKQLAALKVRRAWC